MLRYRADIDGLRAVAVLSVLVFHFNKDWLPGGFLGVDIFFVISGFLITGIIASQVAAERFSFAEFYLRRFRRIYPAAIFVIACTLIVGWQLMLPSDFNGLGQSALSSLASGANVYFWLNLDTSYFANSSEFTPLLHMWSLGVEEQFYLLWPAVVFVVYRFWGVKGVVLAAVAIAVSSFLLSAVFTTSHHSFAYFMLPARAGELLVGALAYFIVGKFQPGRVAAESLAVLGTLGVAACYLLVGDGGQFPGIYAPIVASAVAAVIVGGASGHILGRLLSLPPIVYVGRLSYSLYLWHWPVLALHRYTYGEPQGFGYLLCLGVIILGTVVSYYFVEKPYRFGRIGHFRALAAASASTVLVGLSFVSFTQHDSMLTADVKAADQYHFNCQVSSFDTALLADSRCLIGSAGRPSALLVGDSNAGHLVGLFAEVGAVQGVSIRNATHSGCPPFPDGASDLYVKAAVKDSCRRYNEAVWEAIPDYDTVIVSAAWNYYWQLDTKGYIPYLKGLVDRLANNGRRVIIVLQVPFFKDFDRLCVQKMSKVDGLDCLKRGVIPFSKETKINADLSVFAKRHSNVEVLTLRNVLCAETTCSAYLGGMPLYYDAGHLSMQGSKEIGRYLVRNGQAPSLH